MVSERQQGKVRHGGNHLDFEKQFKPENIPRCHPDAERRELPPPPTTTPGGWEGGSFNLRDGGGERSCRREQLSFVDTGSERVQDSVFLLRPHPALQRQEGGRGGGGGAGEEEGGGDDS